MANSSVLGVARLKCAVKTTVTSNVLDRTSTLKRTDEGIGGCMRQGSELGHKARGISLHRHVGEIWEKPSITCADRDVQKRKVLFEYEQRSGVSFSFLLAPKEGSVPCWPVP